MRQDGALFARQVLSIGDAYGGPRFWLEIALTDTCAENLWRSLLYLGCLGWGGGSFPSEKHLEHPDSRVRAWACFVLGREGALHGSEFLRRAVTDPSPRVRFRARQALTCVLGKQELDNLPGVMRFNTRARIVVSDDSEGVRDQIGWILQHKDLDLIGVSTPEETLEVAHSTTPDAILTDNQKGRDNTSGLRMVEQISRDSTLAEVPIMMFTADPVEGPFFWCGGDAFALKGPGGPRVLQAATRELLWN